jgi:hypothetical protein
VFGRSEIAGMRDWAAARNHCPERDAFRREHERHRAWGLRRRHAAKLRHVRQHQPAPPTAPASRDDHTRPAAADRRPLTRQAETPQVSSAPAATPCAAATMAPASAARSAAVPRDAAPASPVATPPAPAPALRRVPQPAGPQPQPRRVPQPTPVPRPPPDPTLRRPPAPAAAPDKTSTKFRGHRVPVVTVTPGRRPIPRGPPGSPCRGPADKPNNGMSPASKRGRLGNTGGMPVVMEERCRRFRHHSLRIPNRRRVTRVRRTAMS